MKKYITWKLKEDAYPELTPESRARLNEQEDDMCRANALFGYEQGWKHGFAQGIICALAGAITGVIIGCHLESKDKKKKLNKKAS